MSQNEDERLAFWAGRKAAFPAVGRISPDYMCMDGTIPRKALPAVLAGIAELSRKYDLRCANVFHAGDGNLHPLILFDANKPGELERAEGFGADILRLCVKSGGVLTGEHGVGIEKRDLMPEVFSEADLAQQQRVKCAFDSGGLLNPGKSVSGAAPLRRTGPHACLGRQAAVPRHSAVLRGRAMAETAKPSNAEDLQQVIAWAAGTKTPLDLIGSGSKRGIGRPVEAAMVLDLSSLTGIDAYEPDELVLTAGAATPLLEIEALLAQRNQVLAFEPPHFDKLLGSTGAGTLGGIIAGNLSGPRRLKAGAARDHFLGFSGVSGRGETFKSGSRVMKNVTGYDLPKLLAGSWGTLAALSSVTVKVLPAAETEVTLAVATASPEAACQVMSEAMQGNAEASGAAYVPAALTTASAVRALAGAGHGLTFFRIEGIAPSVAYRAEALTGAVSAFGEVVVLAQADSRIVWREIRDVAFLADRPKRPLWRVSVPPATRPPGHGGDGRHRRGPRFHGLGRGSGVGGGAG